MYISYPQYQEMMGKADEIQFPILEIKARKKLDFWTQNRIQNDNITPEIRIIMSMLIDFYFDYNDENKRVSSVSNDGISISYTENESNKDKEYSIYKYAVEILPLELISRCL